jgi:acyl carrier protein
MDEKIRSILAEHGRLPVDVATIVDDDDLFDAGMTSHSSVNVMLALEEEFDMEFPESMLNKSTFESVTAIRTALAGLTGSSSNEEMEQSNGTEARS